jgi:hypothetical protein
VTVSVATAMPIPIAMVAVAVAMVVIVAAERPLRLMDSRADGRTDFLPCRSGLGLGAVRRRGDRLAHILRPSVARTTVPVPVAMVAVSVSTAVPIPVATVPAAAIAIATATATLARVGPTLAVTTTVPIATVATTAVATTTATALCVGDAVMDRPEGNRQTAKEGDQCDHDDGHDHSPEERSHG